MTHTTLSPSELEAFGAEIDALLTRTKADLGERDTRYIRRVVRVQRGLAVAGRALLFASGFSPLFPLVWALGTGALAASKILENMEIGHNVLHGQYDFTHDPTLSSQTYEWDIVCPSEQWRHSHNVLHHTYTNVIGKDHDLGYGIMRVDEDQRWVPFYLGQPAWNLINAFLFEYSIAAYDLQIGKAIKGRTDRGEFKTKGAAVLRKARRQATRDYVVHPLLSGPSALTTLAATKSEGL